MFASIESEIPVMQTDLNGLFLLFYSDLFFQGSVQKVAKRKKIIFTSHGFHLQHFLCIKL